MRHSFKIALTLALLCAVSHGSFIESIINSTKLRGKGTFDTTNGLNMGYQAGLSFNLGGREINLVDVGVNFNATPTVSKVQDTVTTSVRYNGALTFTEATNTSSTNVTISGQTQLASTINSTYDNKTKSTNTVVDNLISDTNSFVIRSGTTVITARGTESLGSKATVTTRAWSFQASQNANLTANVRGVVVKNGTSLGAFTTSTQTISNTSQRGIIPRPSRCRPAGATFNGQTSFTNENFLSFQNTNYNSSKAGSAKFTGISRIGDRKVKTSNKVTTDLGLTYNYQASASVNNTVIGTSSVKGVGKTTTVIDPKNTTSGSSSEFFSGGKLYQVAQVSNGSTSIKPITLSTFDEFAEESTEFVASRVVPVQAPRPVPQPVPVKVQLQDPNSYYSTLTVGWKAGALTTTEVTSNTTATTNTTAGIDYNVKGIDSKSWKPWSTSGSESVSTSFKTTLVDNQVNSVNNIKFGANTSPEFKAKLAQIQVPEVDTKGIYFPEKPRL